MKSGCAQVEVKRKYNGRTVMQLFKRTMSYLEKIQDVNEARAYQKRQEHIKKYRLRVSNPTDTILHGK